MRAEHKHLVDRMRIPCLKYSGKKPEEKMPERKSGHADDQRVPPRSYFTGGQWLSSCCKNSLR